ncbi:MAG TPA: glycosyltransferase [Dehalococcoidales bacterium]|nr:glycosyltransferase [Dehalococcoidales bacterium]
MAVAVKVQNMNEKGNSEVKKTRKSRGTPATEPVKPPAHGVIYSKQLNFCPFTAPPLKAYAHIIGEERTERVQRAAERLKGRRVLELNATAQGGGVAEMLYSSVPFLNNLGVDTEWKVISGNDDFFECTKGLHNLLQGMKGTFSQEMERAYYCTITDCARSEITGNSSDIIMVNDPQPLGLARHLKKSGETWLWRCHIDIEETPMDANPGLWDFMTNWIESFDAAIFSAAHYVVTRWPLPNFIIPPFIDPLSEKNRELSQSEIDQVLVKYEIDNRVPIVAQIGRFDPWKGLDRTIATFRHVRKEQKCQLILAGGMASDDPEGARILAKIYEDTKNDEDVHILHLSLENRLENWKEVNALQRSASVIMQPSTREGFGLVITEALWKAKPVIASNVGAIPLQIRDGDTGYFYETPQKTAGRVINLLKNRKAAEAFGQRAKEYVGEHFLLPDRIADYLMAMDMAMKGDGRRPMPSDSIISFHPWFKMSKRRK